MHLVGVIGQGHSDPSIDALAAQVGAGLARAGCSIVTGGLGGVMAAAARGFREAAGDEPGRGLVIGILPGSSAADANPHVDVPIATGLGEARNVIVATAPRAVVAIGGGPGTLSEIAFALKQGKRVVSLRSWDVDERIERVETPEAAVTAVLGSA